MQIRTRLHECKATGKLALGVFSAMNSPDSIEMIVANTRPDWVGVDLQHSAVTIEGAVHQLRAIQAADPHATPMVRLPQIDTHIIEQSLDAGYMGLIAPMVESADHARALVKAAYYPPRGARSAAGSVRATMYDNYAGSVNDHVFVWPQIESGPGLEHVEEIAAVEGVTGMLFGPGDMCLSNGWKEKDPWAFAPFLQAVQRFLAACRKYKRDAAILVGGQGAIRAREVGFQFIGIGGDAYWVRADICPLLNNRMKELRDVAVKS